MAYKVFGVIPSGNYIDILTNYTTAGIDYWTPNGSQWRVRAYNETGLYEYKVDLDMNVTHTEADESTIGQRKDLQQNCYILYHHILKTIIHEHGDRFIIMCGTHGVTHNTKLNLDMLQKIM